MTPRLPSHTLSSMRHWLGFLFIVLADSSAQADKVPFLIPNSPFSASLLLTKDQEIVSQEKQPRGAGFTVKSADGLAEELMVEISRPNGAIVWKHNFGFNLSATPGCRIAVSYEPKTRLCLVSYDGYKWDHSAKILFADSNGSVSEYTKAQKEIPPLLKKQPDFPQGFDYYLEPIALTERGATFKCIPIQLPERESAHPFAQDQPWYTVEAVFNATQKLVPSESTVSRSH